MEANTLMSAVTSSVGTVLSWIGDVVSALTASDGALKELLPLVAIGIGVSAVMLGFRAVKSFCWGA